MQVPTHAINREQAEIVDGSEVEVSVADGVLIVRPSGKAYSLDELVDRITPENRHDEVDWGAPEGKETR